MSFQDTWPSGTVEDPVYLGSERLLGNAQQPSGKLGLSPMCSTVLPGKFERNRGGCEEARQKVGASSKLKARMNSNSSRTASTGEFELRFGGTCAHNGQCVDWQWLRHSSPYTAYVQ